MFLKNFADHRHEKNYICPTFFLILKDNNIQFEQNDLIYIFGEEIEIRKICSKVENNFNIQNCVVFGADKLGVTLQKN